MNPRPIDIQCTGYSIKTDWYEGSDNSKILLVLPGFTSSKARQKVHAEAMVRMTGTSALVVDFSGHGESPFDINETRPAQHFLELIYVFDWLKEKYPPARLSVSGSSYGGFLAVQLTKYREFDNLIVRAPAIYKPAAFYDLWSKRSSNAEAYANVMMRYRTDASALAQHPMLARASNFKGNTLVVVHEKDEVVPRETTDAFIRTFSADTILAEGFTHKVDRDVKDPAKLEDYQVRIASWLNRLS